MITALSVPNYYEAYFEGDFLDVFFKNSSVTLVIDGNQQILSYEDFYAFLEDIKELLHVSIYDDILFKINMEHQ